MIAARILAVISAMCFVLAFTLALMLAPDMTKGTFAADAASASMSSASRRKIPATPVGEMPNGLA